MDKRELYKEHAEECLAFAQTVPDPMWQSRLLALAAEWHELAEREARPGREAKGHTPAANDARAHAAGGHR